MTSVHPHFAVLDRIIRSVCAFHGRPSAFDWGALDPVLATLDDLGYDIQTRRVVVPSLEVAAMTPRGGDRLVGMGYLKEQQFLDMFSDFCQVDGVSVAIDTTHSLDSAALASRLLELANVHPAKLFEVGVVTNPRLESPFFPVAIPNGRDCYTIGLQATSLFAAGMSLEQWIGAIQREQATLESGLAHDPHFGGIDLSIAPLGSGFTSIVEIARVLMG